MPLSTLNDPDIAWLTEDITLEEQELLCQPDYAAALTIKRQQKIAGYLATVFATGFDRDRNQYTARDQWKVEKYESIHSQTPPKSPTLFRTDMFYKFHVRAITHLRLLLVRFNRLMMSTFRHGRTLLPAFFSIFGLSYGISFAFDCGVVLKTTLVDPTPDEAHPWQRRWTRFKNVLQKDNRPYRMLNDAIWFTINLATFCLIGPAFAFINPLLNIIGFVFDTIHEFFWFGWERRKYTRLEEKLKQKDNSIREDHYLKDDIKAERIASLNEIRAQLKQELDGVIKKRFRIAFSTLWIFIGMAFILLVPPAIFPAAAVVSSLIVLIAGCGFTGITHMIKSHYYPWLRTELPKWFKKDTATNTDIPSPSIQEVPPAVQKITFPKTLYVEIPPRPRSPSLTSSTQPAPPPTRPARPRSPSWSSSMTVFEKQRLFERNDACFPTSKLISPT